MEMLNSVMGMTSSGVNYLFNQIDRFNLGRHLATAAESSYAPLGFAVAAQIMLRTLNHYENSKTFVNNGGHAKKPIREQTWTTLIKQITATTAGFTLLQLALKKEGLAGLNGSLAKDVLITTTLTIGDDRAIERLFVKQRGRDRINSDPNHPTLKVGECYFTPTESTKMDRLYKTVAAGYLAARLFDLGFHQGVGFNNLLRGDFSPMKATYISAFQTVRSFI
jgi:hypothetical protein